MFKYFSSYLLFLISYLKKKNLLVICISKKINNNNLLVMNYIDKNAEKNIFVKIDNINNIKTLKNCSDIHIEILNKNKGIIETSSLINGKINYTFLPKNMEKEIVKKYFNLKISYEIVSEINELNKIYNIILEVYRDNKLICSGLLNNIILVFNDSTDKFIIELLRNKYIIDTRCFIKLVSVNFLYNKKNIYTNNF